MNEIGMNEEAQFIAAVEEGLRALDKGRVISHAEVKSRFEQSQRNE
jgi:predicted transcriptional regulator